MKKFMTPKEAIARLPVPIKEKRFRALLAEFGLGYRFSRQKLMLDEEQLSAFVERFRMEPRQKPQKRRNRRESADAMAQALKMLE